jgi:hypothetical protein
MLYRSVAFRFMIMAGNEAEALEQEKTRVEINILSVAASITSCMQYYIKLRYILTCGHHLRVWNMYMYSTV